MVSSVSIQPDAVYDERLFQALEVSAATLVRARREGRLRYTRKGKHTLYLGRWVLDWLGADTGHRGSGQGNSARPDPSSVPPALRESTETGQAAPPLAGGGVPGPVSRSKAGHRSARSAAALAKPKARGPASQPRSRCQLLRIRAWLPGRRCRVNTTKKDVKAD
jgi:hypothetical protein